MATLINLVLIDSKEDEKGKLIFKRQDTGEIVPVDSINLLNEPSIILKFDYNKPFPKTIPVRIEEYKMAADSLLLGGEVKEQDAVYYAASFCRINKKE